MSHQRSSSYSSPNYMDGVPVKISEKYKPPPKVSLPQGILQRLAAARSSTDELFSETNYDFSLERNVLGKINEWKNVRYKEQEERRERMRRRQQEHQKQLEETQKQLLTAVSYPSAADLSSDDDGGDETAAEDSNEEPTSSNNDELKVVQSGQLSPVTNSFDRILMPTVLGGGVTTTEPHLQANSTATYSKPAEYLRPTIGYTPGQTVEHNANNYHKINYSDFENDTSSPFDNVELKTINDLDILAQVLNLNITHSNKNDEQTTTATTAIGPQQQQQHQIITDENIQNSNSYYPPTATAAPLNYQNLYQQYSNNPIVENITHHQSYAAQYNNHQPIYKNTENYYNYSPSGEQNNVNVQLHRNDPQSQSSLPPKNDYYFNYQQHNMYGAANPYGYAYNNLGSPTIGGGSAAAAAVVAPTISPPLANSNAQHHQPFQQQLVQQPDKLKSKSVPDILKELNAELTDSEQKRQRNNSQSISSPHDDVDPSLHVLSEYAVPVQQHQQQLKQSNESFRKLSISSQKIVKIISSMGFPLEQVCRVADKLGGRDDKKIVEHLIPLGELLDLGFDESRISDALIKFDNNKDKALDYLIS